MSFVVGQKVCLRDRYLFPQEILTVVKSGTRKLVLSDGSEWRADGRRPWGRRPWGNNDPWYTGNRVTRLEDGDERKIDRSMLTSWATSARWDVVPLKILKQVHALVQPIITAWEQKQAEKGGSSI